MFQVKQKIEDDFNRPINRKPETQAEVLTHSNNYFSVVATTQCVTVICVSVLYSVHVHTTAKITASCKKAAS